MAPNQHYTTFKAEDILEIKRTRLQVWLDRGYILPFHKAKGKGDKTLFSVGDLYKIRLFKEFLDRGIQQRERAAYMLSLLDKPKHLPGGGTRKVNWKKDYFCYIEFSHDEHPKLKGALGYTGLYSDEFPPHEILEEHVFHLIFNLRVIKRLVDKKLK